MIIAPGSTIKLNGETYNVLKLYNVAQSDGVKKHTAYDLQKKGSDAPVTHLLRVFAGKVDLLKITKAEGITKDDLQLD